MNPDLRALLLFAKQHPDEWRRHNAQLRFLNAETMARRVDRMTDPEAFCQYLLDGAASPAEREAVAAFIERIKAARDQRPN